MKLKRCGQIKLRGYGKRRLDSVEKLKEQFLKKVILDENEEPIEEKNNLKRFVIIVKKIIILNKTRKTVEIFKKRRDTNRHGGRFQDDATDFRRERLQHMKEKNYNIFENEEM